MGGMQHWPVLTVKGMKPGMIRLGTGIGLTFSSGGRSSNSISSSASSKNDSLVVWFILLDYPIEGILGDLLPSIRVLSRTKMESTS